MCCAYTVAETFSLMLVRIMMGSMKLSQPMQSVAVGISVASSEELPDEA